MSTNPTLTAERLREVLDYDPGTGVFRWRVSRPGVHAGTVAGSVSASQGYRFIWVNRSKYSAHRLAWLHAYGVWPAGELDHRNWVRDDNRLANLREATGAQNSQNRRGCAGFYPSGRGWRATIMVDGKSHNLGTFDTPEEASAAYVAAKKDLHPFWVEAS